MLDLDDFHTLAHGLPDAWLCAHLDITPRTLRNYRRGCPVPKAIKELLRFVQYGELSAIAGPEWAGFTLRNGALQIPFFPRPFTPEHVKAMFFITQDAWAIRADLAQAQAQIVSLRAELEAEKKRTRSQVRVMVDGCEVFVM